MYQPSKLALTERAESVILESAKEPLRGLIPTNPRPTGGTDRTKHTLLAS
jgi:hypothetical protein